MTLGHFIYIPGMFLLGLLIGYILRGKVADAARNEAAEIDDRRRAREARRQARGERQVGMTYSGAGSQDDSRPISTTQKADSDPHGGGENTTSSKPS